MKMAVSDLHIDEAVGTEIDGYRITGVLGRGGMGVVYEAEDVALGKRVALKMIDPVYARDEQFLRRFQAEARALGRLNEPHIVNVYALRRTEAGSFIVMECVDGRTLADRLLEGPLSVQDALPLVRQMLTAFRHAHKLGVIHRDIKPGNIMLTREGMVKVTDFGLAKLQQGQAAATVTQGAAGTLYYMSPEQVKALPTLDHRSDLYSLAMTLYEALAGKLPFDKDQSEFAIMRTIVEENPPPLSRLNPDVPRALSDIVMKALAKDPNRRYSDAGAMLAAIEDFERSQFAEGDTVADSRQYRHSTRLFGGRGPLVLAAGVLLAALAAGAFWIYASGQDGVQPPDDPLDPPATMAVLSIATTPEGALVRIDGREVGTSPLTDSLVAREEGVRVQLELDGYSPVDTHLFLTAAQTLPMAIALRAETDENTGGGGEVRPGFMVLHARGEGLLSVNGRRVTNGARLSLPEGTHRLQCGEPPHELNTRFTVRPGQEQAITCHFTAKININTQMEDGGLGPPALILINGADTGLEAPKEIERGPGVYTITVQKFDFEVLNEERVTIEPSLSPQETRFLSFRLRRTS